MTNAKLLIIPAAIKKLYFCFDFCFLQFSELSLIYFTFSKLIFKEFFSFIAYFE